MNDKYVILQVINLLYLKSNNINCSFLNIMNEIMIALSINWVNLIWIELKKCLLIV
jgi:hypothetical protein